MVSVNDLIAHVSVLLLQSARQAHSSQWSAMNCADLVQRTASHCTGARASADVMLATTELPKTPNGCRAHVSCCARLFRLVTILCCRASFSAPEFDCQLHGPVNHNTDLVAT